MIVGIPDREWGRIRRSVHFTERREVGAGGRLRPGLGSGAPVFVRVGGVAATGSTTACDRCPAGAPLTWTATLSGFGVCGAAPDPNGALTLTHSADCTWAGTLNGAAWTLAYVGGAWELTDDTIGARYTLTGALWSCTGPNELGRAAVAECGESPATLLLTAGSEATVHTGAYEAVFQVWDNDTATFVDADTPNECYAVDVDGEELEEGKVYIGAVVWQYAESGKVLVAVDDAWGGSGFNGLTTSTLLPCPVPTGEECCVLYPECQQVFDCNGEPISRTAVDFSACADGIDGVRVTIPTQCESRVTHCGNTVGACEPRCDYPDTDDTLADAGDPGTCCTPTGGSVMEGSPHAGECGFFPPCVVVAGGNGTDTLAGIAFEVSAAVNYDAEWPFAYTAPGGNFYITGRLVLCLESPFPGWYFEGRIYVYNPAGHSGSYDPDECGCDTVFGACPTAADDASQEIVAFHLGDKTETLRLTTACGTFDLTISPCDVPDVPADVEYACVAGTGGNICTETVGGPFLNDPTCGGKCDEADPDPDPVTDLCCDDAGAPLENHPDLRITYIAGGVEYSDTLVWNATEYVKGGSPPIFELFCQEPGGWSLEVPADSNIDTPIVVSCVPFGLVFDSDGFTSSGIDPNTDITVAIA